MPKYRVFNYINTLYTEYDCSVFSVWSSLPYLFSECNPKNVQQKSAKTHQIRQWKRRVYSPNHNLNRNPSSNPYPKPPPNPKPPGKRVSVQFSTATPWGSSKIFGMTHWHLSPTDIQRVGGGKARASRPAVFIVTPRRCTGSRNARPESYGLVMHCDPKRSIGAPRHTGTVKGSVFQGVPRSSLVSGWEYTLNCCYS